MDITKKTNKEIAYKIGWDLEDITLLCEEIFKRIDKQNETS